MNMVALPEGWLTVSGCYMGPAADYPAYLKTSCEAPYSTCPCPMPKATTALMPTMTGTARVLTVSEAENPMTPFELVRPLPSIVNNDAVDMAPPCSTFTEWVANNPLLAGGLLVGAGLLLFGRKKS